MRESELLHYVCDALCEASGREVIPETWRDGCVSVFLTGGDGCVREYVCGGGVFELPIEVKLREVVRCEADRLRVLDVIAEIGEIGELPPRGKIMWAELCSRGSARCDRTHDNGSAEYVLPLRLRYSTAEQT